MSYGNDRPTNAIYFSIGVTVDDKGKKQACFGLRATKDTPNAKQVFKKDGTAALDKNNNEVYRLEYNFVNGTIIAFDETSRDFNGSTTRYLNIHMTDGGDNYIVQLPRGERYWADFLMRLPNLDLSKPVRMQPANILGDDGKSDMFLSMKQDGVKITRAYTQANNYGNNDLGEGGLPPGEKKEVNEKDVWDFSNRNKFLEKLLETAKEKIAFLTSVPPAEGEPLPAAAAVEEDDLPF